MDSETGYVSLKWSKYKPSLSSNLNRCFEAQTGVDVSLACEGQTLRCHRVLLSAVSPFFEAILRDIYPPQYPVLILTDVKFEEINAIVQFLYSGEVIVETKKVNNLMKTAEKLQITGLTEGMTLADSDSNAASNVSRMGGKLLRSKSCSKKGSRTESRAKSVGKPTKAKTRLKGNRRSKRKSTPTQREEEDDIEPEEEAEAEDDLRGKSNRKKGASRETNLETGTSAAISPAAPEDEGTATSTLNLVPIVSTLLIGSQPPLFCDICGIVCLNEAVLRGHRKVHEDSSRASHPRDSDINCDSLLEEGEKSKGGSNSSKKRSRGKLHGCPHCPYASEHYTNLAHHIRTHTGEKPHECDVCQTRFTRKDSLKHHMRKHTGERPFSCVICEKRFLFKHNLASHFGAVHSNGQRNHKCEICSKTFALKTNLKKHMDTHEVKNVSKRVRRGRGAKGLTSSAFPGFAPMVPASAPVSVIPIQLHEASVQVAFDSVEDSAIQQQTEASDFSEATSCSAELIAPELIISNENADLAAEQRMS